MVLLRCLIGVLAVSVLAAEVFPLKDIRPGMRGIGKTVFEKDRIEEFQVEILGVLENVGPSQSIILGRLSGGPLERTGVMQGMSGSPVYLDGKLAGAVAMAFSFSKEPIAGIRPIEEMLQVAGAEPAERRAKVSVVEPELSYSLPRREVAFGEAALVDIATPVSFAGFTKETLDRFGPQLRSLGLEPRQGVSGGGSPSASMGDPARLEPGSMISVQLLTGDMSIGAEGTVTHVDGKRLYAFGHRFLSLGAAELPFARAEVLTLLPNLSTSFKISSVREWMGAITQDYNAAVTGELGRRAALVPVSVSMAGKGPAPAKNYGLRMVNDRFLSPLLLQMAVYSAIDASERTLGVSSFLLRGEIQFENGTPPIRLDNMYAGDFNVPIQVSLGIAAPLAYALQSGFEDLRLKSVNIELQSFDEKKHMQIDQAWASRPTARPGEEIELTVALAGDNGAEVLRKVRYRVPVGAPLGPLYFTVADGTTTNMTEFQQFVNSTRRSAAQVVSLLNGLRGNTKAYVRVWRAERSFQVHGEELPDPPPSVALILQRTQPALGGLSPSQNSKVAELAIDAGEFVITGSKTVQVEVKE